MAGIQFQIAPTPNPNSIRIGLSTVVTPTNLSFSSAVQAESHPLAKRLFEVPGVTLVFMMNNFISVNKDPGADWAKIEPKVAEILQGHFNA